MPSTTLATNTLINRYGARTGMVAVDEITLQYLKGRPFAPKGELWDKAVAYWKTLVSDPGAKYDRVLVLNAKDIAQEAMRIASDICIYTNGNFTIEEL